MIERATAWLENVTFLRWSRIEGLANGDLVKLIASIPVFGYLILFNDQIVGSTTYTKIVGLDSNSLEPFFLDGLTKLRFAFFGGILVFFGNSLFRLSSPEVLKHSKDDLTFSNWVENGYSAAEIHKLEDVVLSTSFCRRIGLIDEKYVEMVQKGQAEKNFARFEDMYLIKSHKDELREISREYWVGQDFSKPLKRLLTFILTVAGFVCLVIPTLDLTQAVLIGMFRQ